MITTVSKYSKYMVTYLFEISEEEIKRLENPFAISAVLERSIHKWFENLQKTAKYRISKDNIVWSDDGLSYEMSFGFLDEKLYKQFRNDFKKLKEKT